MIENIYESGKSLRYSANAENRYDERGRAANAVMALGCAAAVVFLTFSVGGKETKTDARYYTDAENEEIYSVFASDETDTRPSLESEILDLAGKALGLEEQSFETGR